MLAACGGNSVEQGENNPDGSTFTIEQIQDSPLSYVGEITLTGIVGNISSREFALQNEGATFEVTVDYRGSQAMPVAGSRVSVSGQLTENRPCCGPGFTLTAMQFEILE